jgi:hypothetical protein
MAARGQQAMPAGTDLTTRVCLRAAVPRAAPRTGLVADPAARMTAGARHETLLDWCQALRGGPALLRAVSYHRQQQR